MTVTFPFDAIAPTGFGIVRVQVEATLDLDLMVTQLSTTLDGAPFELHDRDAGHAIRCAMAVARGQMP